VIFIQGFTLITANMELEEIHPGIFNNFNNTNNTSFHSIILPIIEVENPVDGIESDFEQSSENSTDPSEPTPEKQKEKTETINVSNCKLKFHEEKIKEFENKSNKTEIFQYEYQVGITHYPVHYKLDNAIEFLSNKARKSRDETTQANIYENGKSILTETLTRNATMRVPGKTKYIILQTVGTCGTQPEVLFEIHTPKTKLRAIALESSSVESEDISSGEFYESYDDDDFGGFQKFDPYDYKSELIAYLDDEEDNDEGDAADEIDNDDVFPEDQEIDKQPQSNCSDPSNCEQTPIRIQSRSSSTFFVPDTGKELNQDQEPSGFQNAAATLFQTNYFALAITSFVCFNI